MMLLSLQKVSIRFGSLLLLDKVSLQLERGERVCLLGRNGEGKSTLLKLINGELVADSGDIIRQKGLCNRLPSPGNSRRITRYRIRNSV